MSTTLRLDSVRFVKRVTNGANLSKYGYIGMMESLADAIKSAPWVKSGLSGDAVTLTTNKLTKTDGVWNSETGSWTTKPTYSAYLNDCYDAFNQAGDAVSANATMCGYSGCVAYRFSVPASESANTLEAVKLSIQRDRYLRAGVRIGMQISSSETPSDDWSVIRGEASGCVRSSSTSPAEGVIGVSSFGFLGQPDVQYLTASRAASGTVEFDTSSSFTGLTTETYLWVYVTLEDPSAYWYMYSETAQRQYYIEGSAMIVADGCFFTFANAVSAPSGEEFYIGTGADFGICAYDGTTEKWQRGDGSDFVKMSINGLPAAIDSETGLPTLVYNLHNQGTSILSVPEDGVSAVRGCYAAFYADRMTRSASLSITQGFRADSNGGSFGFAFQVLRGSVTLCRRKLLMPFSVPYGFDPRSIRIEDYYVSSEDGFSCYSDQIGQLDCSVWLKSGAIYSYESADLQDHHLYLADVSECRGWKKIGTFSVGTKGDTTIKYRTHFNEVFPLPSKLTPGPYTLLFTAYAGEDQITITDGVADTQNLGNGFDSGYYDYYDDDLGKVLCVSDGIIPKATLIG